MAGLSETIGLLAGGGTVTDSSTTASDPLKIGGTSSTGASSRAPFRTAPDRSASSRSGLASRRSRDPILIPAAPPSPPALLDAGSAENAGVNGPFGIATTAGAIFMTGGTLQYSAANQFDYSGCSAAGGTQSFNIDTNGQTVTFAAAPLTGTASTLTKTGAGTLALAVANSYSGTTTISVGTLSLQNDDAVSSSALVLSGGTLLLQSDTNGDTFATGGVTTISSGSTISADHLTTGTGNTLKLANDVNVTAATTVTVTFTNADGYGVSLGNVTQTSTSATTLTLADNGIATLASYTTVSTATPKLSVQGTGVAVIAGNVTQGTGALALDRSGQTGMLILQGTSNLTGAVTITNGTIQISQPTNALGSPSGGSTISIGASGTLALRGDTSATFGNGTVPYSVALTASGATINVDEADSNVSTSPYPTLTLGTVTMSSGSIFQLNATGADGVSLSLGTITAATSETISNTIIPNSSSAGALILAGFTDTNASNPTFTLKGTGNSTITGALTQNGAMLVVYNDTGTTTLDGQSTYTSSTTVSAGTIILGAAGIGTSSPLGTVAQPVTILAGGALDLNGFSLGIAKGLNLNGTGPSGAGALLNSSPTTSTCTGAIVLQSNATIDANVGAIDETGQHHRHRRHRDAGRNRRGKHGCGQYRPHHRRRASRTASAMRFLGSSGSTYTGTTTINVGTLKLGASSTSGNASSPLGSPTGGTIVNNGATLDLNGFSITLALEALTLNGSGVSGIGALVNTGGVSSTFDGSITLGSDASIVASGAAILLTSTATATVSGTANLTLGGTVAGSSMNFAVNNTGSLIKTGTGSWALTKVNTYTGGTTVQGGTLTVSGSTATLGASGSPLEVDNPNTGAGTAVVVNLSSVSGTILSNLSGSIATPSSGTNTANINNGGKLLTDNQTTAATFAGVIAGSGGFTFAGAAVAPLTLTGTSAYTGATTLTSGILDVNGSLTSSAITLASGATLGGNGTVGDVTAVSNGILSPGTATVPSTLTTGNLVLDSSVLQLDLASATSFSSVDGTGSTIDITGSTLSLMVGAVTNGETFTILSIPGNNPSARTVGGTFANLPGTGATFTVGSVVFAINYDGGDGNDVDVDVVSGGASPSIVSTVLNGGIAYVNNTAVSQQHSMVENIVYSFSQAVSLSTTNFALTGINGTANGPTVALSSSPDGTVWTLTFTGAGVNTATGSIGDGEYDLALSGVPGLASSTYDFYRLLGDMDGNGVVDSADFSIFISSFLRGTNDPAYFGADDLDGNNKIDSADFSEFESNFLHSLPNTTLLH